MEGVKARAVQYGKCIGVNYAEGYITTNPVGIKDVSSLVGGLS
jgi:hypothetical protein